MKRLYPSRNIFLSGGDIASIGQGAANLGLGMMSNLQGADTDTVEAPEIEATSKSDLLAQMNAYNGTYLGREKTGLAALSGGLSGAMSGMQAGSAFSPIGAGIGAGIGLIGGGLSGLFGAKKRNKERAAKERDIDNYVNQQFMAANEALSQTAMDNTLANYSAYGGNLFAYGGNFSDGLTSFEAGGTHEENPNDGILQGMDSEGNPNLVEEGETKWNNYIFSNRLKPGKDFTTQFNLPKAIQNKSYAKASEYLAKDAQERPNDPISQKGLAANMNRLQESQESLKAYEDIMNLDNDVNILGLGQMMAKGGDIDIKPSKRGTFTAAAKKRGKSVQGFASQVLANKGNYSPAMVKKAQFAKNAAKWHALGGPMRNVQNRFNVYNGNVTTFDWGGNLPNTHYDKYHPGRIGQGANIYAIGDFVDTSSEYRAFNQAANEDLNVAPIETNTTPEWMNHLGMYAPAITNIGLAISAMGEQPEQFKFNRVSIDPANKMNTIFPYKPIDREYIANKLRSQAGATRRGIINTAGGNRAIAQAGLLAADRNYLDSIGDAYFKTDDINYNRFIDARTRSNQAKAMNNQQDMQAQMFNTQVGSQEQQLNAANRAAARNMRRDAISKIGETFGNIGRNRYDKSTIETMFGNRYSTEGKWLKGKSGKIKTKK